MSHSKAQRAQKKHWERSGQINRTIGLIFYMLKTDSNMPSEVKNFLETARWNLAQARKCELRNNEFINLNLTPTWRKQR